MQQRISTGMPVAVSPERALIPHAHSRTSDPKNSRHGFFIHRYLKRAKPMTSATALTGKVRVVPDLAVQHAPRTGPPIPGGGSPYADRCGGSAGLRRQQQFLSCLQTLVRRAAGAVSGELGVTYSMQGLELISDEQRLLPVVVLNVPTLTGSKQSSAAAPVHGRFYS